MGNLGTLNEKLGKLSDSAGIDTIEGFVSENPSKAAALDKIKGLDKPSVNLVFRDVSL